MMVHKTGWRYSSEKIPDPKHHYYVVVKVSLHDPIEEMPFLPNAIKQRVFNAITQHIRHTYTKQFEYRNIKVKLDHIVDLNKEKAA
jgi:hypothetical protein